ncbi:hypothetical protein BHM03_00039911 [Ensete ventricosum]|nr:hypothetical protein BHM03_00039911 [Ensete ventricosum]
MRKGSPAAATSPPFVRGWEPAFPHSSPNLLEAHCPGSQGRGPKEPNKPFPNSSNILLNFTRTEIFLQIQEKGLLKTPNSMRTRAKERDRGRFYRFYHNYGHDIEECYDLKN